MEDTTEYTNFPSQNNKKTPCRINFHKLYKTFQETFNENHKGVLFEAMIRLHSYDLLLSTIILNCIKRLHHFL